MAESRQTKYRERLLNGKQLPQAGVLLVTMLVCITQEAFVVLELWEPCLNSIRIRTYEDNFKPVLLPAISIGVMVDDYLDYLLTNTNHENHYIRDEQAEDRRQTIKHHMLACIDRSQEFHINMADRWDHYKWYERCIFSTSHQLNISIHDMFDSLLFGDWSHDYLFNVVSSIGLDSRHWIRSTRGALGMYMMWTFFTDSGTTRYSASELIYNQTSGVTGNVFNPYIPINSEGHVFFINSNQSIAENNFFKYTIALHSPDTSFVMDHVTVEKIYWDSSHGRKYVPATVSQNVLIQKKCRFPLGEYRCTCEAICRDYSPFLANNGNESLFDPEDKSNWQCNLDPDLYTCYTSYDCNYLLFFKNPGHTCLQHYMFRKGVAFHYLKSELRSVAKGVACVDPQDVSTPSDADDDVRYAYYLKHNSLEDCPRACHVPGHNIRIASIGDLEPHKTPVLKIIIRPSKEDTFLTVELLPHTTWVQLLVNVFSVAGTWFGLSIYSGIMNAPVWLSTSWKYVSDKIVSRVNLRSMITSFTVNYLGLECCLNRHCFVNMHITSNKMPKTSTTPADATPDVARDRRSLDDDDPSRPPPFRVEIVIPENIWPRDCHTCKNTSTPMTAAT